MEKMMGNLFSKKKEIQDRSELNIEEKVSDAGNMQKEPKTLGDLAESGELFYKFTQAIQGHSIEKVYAEYIPGEITEAMDEEKYLSFVTDKMIANCFMYGDTLTSLKFDLNDERFKKIKDTPFKNLGGRLGEYEAKYLLVDNNYSLSDVNTIVKLFDLVTCTAQLGVIFNYDRGSLDKRLKEFGYEESYELVKYLSNEFKSNIHISPEEIRELIKKYFDK